jgi:hypothetical protein
MTYGAAFGGRRGGRGERAVLNSKFSAGLVNQRVFSGGLKAVVHSGEGQNG